jgi:hypothetical protein
MNGGARCTSCDATAIECKGRYRTAGSWCCPDCRTDGALALHTDTTPRPDPREDNP